jgi:hypothetical protein
VVATHGQPGKHRRVHVAGRAGRATSAAQETSAQPQKPAASSEEVARKSAEPRHSADATIRIAAMQVKTQAKGFRKVKPEGVTEPKVL